MAEGVVPSQSDYNADVSFGGMDAVDIGAGDDSNDIFTDGSAIRGFHVGSAGNVKVTTALGTTLIFEGCLAGLLYPYGCVKVFATGTTASSIIGVF